MDIDYRGKTAVTEAVIQKGEEFQNYTAVVGGQTP